jgi:hypothetical protein
MPCRVSHCFRHACPGPLCVLMVLESAGNPQHQRHIQDKLVLMGCVERAEGPQQCIASCAIFSLLRSLGGRDLHMAFPDSCLRQSLSGPAAAKHLPFSSTTARCKMAPTMSSRGQGRSRAYITGACSERLPSVCPALSRQRALALAQRQARRDRRNKMMLHQSRLPACAHFLPLVACCCLAHADVLHEQALGALRALPQ